MAGDKEVDQVTATTTTTDDNTMADDTTGKVSNQRITREQKDRLWAFFEKQKYPPNEPFPKQGADHELDQLMVDIQIPKGKRNKASQQFLNWKEFKYNHKGKVIPLEDYDLEETMRIHMTVDTNDFIVSVLNDMLNEDENATLTMYASETDHGKKLLTDLLERPACSPLVDFFASIVDKYTSLCVACFPNVAKMADDAEFDFAKQRHTLIPNEWFEEFYDIVLNNLTSFCDKVKKLNF